jgi:hypothetical protein
MNKLPPYKDLYYYLGGLTVISGCYAVFLIFTGNINSSSAIPSMLIAGVSGIILKKVIDSRCPYCKRPFTKVTNPSLEEVEVRERKFWYHTRVLVYPDGHEEKDDRSKKYKLRNAKFGTSFYTCKVCGYGKEREWFISGKFLHYVDDWDAPIPKRVRVNANGYVIKAKSTK